MDKLTGRAIQHYVIDDLIGQGGMGDVYHGVDTATDEPVAIKVLKTELVAKHPAHLERFIREGEILRQLNHPNIVKVLATTEQDDLHFIVMEYVSGGSLRDLLDQQPKLPIARTLSIALGLADALTRAHHLNIIHRDFKPHNILLAEDDTPRLTDFGIAYLAGTTRVTQEGTLIGSPHYLSPEAINQQELDRRTDIWAFGVVLFEMLAGRYPFDGNNLTSLAMAILQHATPDLEQLRPDTPVALVDLIYRMLEKERDRRIPSVRLVGAELEAILQGSSTDMRMSTSSSEHPVSSAESRFDTPTPTITGIVKHNLPVETTPFVGRDLELAGLSGLLAEEAIRLITILGPGGTGKTRLALEAASFQFDNFAHGVYFVPLASLCNQCPDEDFVATVASVIGCQFRREDRPEGTEPGDYQRQQLLDYVSRRSMLLILDNFEHVLNVARLVTAILQAAPEVRILATSRERLNLQEETLVRIRGMDFPEDDTVSNPLEFSAVRLFIQSAQRVQPDFALVPDQTYAERVGRLMASTQHRPSEFTYDTDTLVHVARICRQVRGMPLAILLAAAWVEVLPAAEISREISQSLDFLESEMRNVPDRHRSIRAVFETSWTQLSAAEQTLFKQLSVFQGGFSRHAAQKITGAELRTLMGLVNKSLLSRTAEGRYEGHELLRQYAAERFAESPDERDQMANRHCAYYADFLAQQIAAIKKGSLQTALEEMENLRAAWSWAIQTGNIPAIRQLLPGLATLYDMQNWHQEAKTILDRAVDVLHMNRPRGDQGVIYAQALAFQGTLYCQINMPKEGCALLRESLSTLRRLRAPREFAQAQMMAVTNGAIKDKDEERKTFNECIAAFRKLDMPLELGHTLTILGMSCYRHGELDAAQAHFEEAHAIYSRHNARIGLATILGRLGLIASAKGDYAKARPYFQEALAIWQALGNPGWMSNVFTSWGLAAWRHGDYRESKDMLQEALAVFRESGDLWRVANGLNNLGHPTVALGQYDEALGYYREALELTRGQDIAIYPAVFLEAFIGIANITGKLPIANGQEQAVEWMSMVRNHPLIDTEIDTIAARFLADLKTKLPPDIFAAAVERGQQQDFDDVIARWLIDD